MSEKVGVAIIGTGFARRVQMPAFAACSGARLVSVASATLENARSAAKEFSVTHFTDDWRFSVERDDVDLVCITTPPTLHREIAEDALRRGKHVLCEKPMAMNVAEASEMTAAVAGKSQLALIDHELRFQSGRMRAFEMLRDAQIGEIWHARYVFQAPHRGDASGLWNWWSDASRGGGALGAINSHIIDSFRWLLGTEIASVSCQLQTHIKERRDAGGLRRPVTTDDQANMLMRFERSPLTPDATGLVSVSMVEGPSYRNELEIFGSRGAIKIGHRGELFIAKGGESEWREIDVDLGRGIDGVADTGFSRGFMQFAPKIIEAISTGKSSVEYAATFADGLQVQRVLDAARSSDKERREVQIAEIAG